MRRFHYRQGTSVVRDVVVARAPTFARKFAWFLEKGYAPHLYQMAFHTNCDDEGKLLLNRFLVAGRRGGKTLGAAWEVACYCINPETFHWDAHRKVSDRPLHVWILVPNFATAGRAAKRTFEEVLKQAGLSQGHGFRWNRGENTVEFDNGSFVEFKTAENADSLVGAGIDILWMDETAVIPNQDAFDYASPALDDKMGMVLATTTPRGKNWFHKLGWSPQAVEDPTIGTVEYTSIHNPFYPRERWEYRKRTYHPLRFKQEYMAAFDSMAGKELHGDWLHYYELEDLPLMKPDLGVQRQDGSLRIDNLDLDIYFGVDPAISLSDEADRFGLAVLGIRRDRSKAYLLDMYANRIDFPDQVDLIETYHRRWRPVLIGVETQAYQAALAQQLQRLQSMPAIFEQKAYGKKSQRILSMAPSFRIEQVLIRSEQRDFIDEWLDYDSEKKNTNDDCLDAVEIAMRTAGMLLPGFTEQDVPYTEVSAEELAWKNMPTPLDPIETRGYDEHMGGEW
jgi:phage terminase large subunit-like protein